MREFLKMVLYPIQVILIFLLLCLTPPTIIASPISDSLKELSPFLETLSKPSSAPEIANNLRNFLEKANDVAIETIKKSNSSISEEKLQEFKDDFHGELFSEIEDIFQPIDTD